MVIHERRRVARCASILFRRAHARRMPRRRRGHYRRVDAGPAPPREFLPRHGGAPVDDMRGHQRGREMVAGMPPAGIIPRAAEQDVVGPGPGGQAAKWSRGRSRHAPEAASHLDRWPHADGKSSWGCQRATPMMSPWTAHADAARDTRLHSRARHQVVPRPRRRGTSSGHYCRAAKSAPSRQSRRLRRYSSPSRRGRRRRLSSRRPRRRRRNDARQVGRRRGGAGVYEWGDSAFFIATAYGAQRIFRSRGQQRARSQPFTRLADAAASKARWARPLDDDSRAFAEAALHSCRSGGLPRPPMF